MTQSSIESRKHYKIQDMLGLRFWTGCIAGAEQVIMGLLYPEVIAVFFDSQGKYLRCEARRVPVEAPKHPASGAYVLHDQNFRQALCKFIADWQASLGFTSGTIIVERFFLDDRNMGIKVRPQHFEEFLKNPELVEDELEKQELLTDMREWEEKGMYVLTWGNDYWMTREGEEESS